MKMGQIGFIVFVNSDENIISNNKNNQFSEFLIIHYEIIFQQLVQVEGFFKEIVLLKVLKFA